MLLVKFVVQFVDFFSGLVQCFPARGGDRVDPSLAPSHLVEGRLQQAAAFQSVQEGIESSRADTIPVMGQFLHHGQPEDWFVRSVHQYMNPNKAEKELSLVTGHKVNIRPLAWL